MLFRLILLLAVAGALTVFTVQNLTPLLPLVFLGIQFPALPLSWWVLGAMAAGSASMLAIQVLIGFSNFVTGQTVRSRVRASVNRDAADREDVAAAAAGTASKRQPRRERSTSDDSSWQDWRGYETSDDRSTQTAARSASRPLDDWERPPSEDWETPAAAQPAPRRSSSERVAPPREPAPPPRADAPKRTPRSESVYAEGDRDFPTSRADTPEKVVDADFRVIVPPYRPLDEPMAYTPPPPPPPPVEENADDWFEETSDDFDPPAPTPKPQ